VLRARVHFDAHRYIGLALGTTSVAFLRSILYFASTLRSNTNLHDQSVRRLVHLFIHLRTSGLACARLLMGICACVRVRVCVFVFAV